MSRTGPLVSALADGVRADLEEIASDMEALRAKVETLRETSGALNGLGGDTAGWSNHLLSLLEDVRKESVAVPAKLLGQPVNQIVTHVDGEHLERVKKERRSA